MRKLFTLTLLGLMAIGCAGNYSSKSHTMTHKVATQDQLDAANQRILQLKQELLQQGFREVSVGILNSREQFILEGEYGTLKNPRVTLWTRKQLENVETDVGGGVDAALRDEQAEREFAELYKKIQTAVTGR